MTLQKKLFLFIVCSLFFITSVFTEEIENSPLLFGNPSNAICDINSENNYLLVKDEYTISYNNSNLSPAWCAWHLCSEDLGTASRGNKFRSDKSLPSQWYKVTTNDYQYSAYGFDRGHLCPSADRTSTQKANDETFLMTNMIPQSPDCNRIVWMHLENFERKLVEEGNELYIFAGPAGCGGEGNRGIFNEILVYVEDGIKKINVPKWCWKIILVLPEGEKDIVRVLQNNVKIISVCIPNTMECNKDADENKIDWNNYLCSVDYIEEITGFDFFNILPDDFENKIEKEVWSYE